MDIGGKSMEFVTGYEDYRMHQGRLAAFKEIHIVGGNATGYTDILQIAFPEKLPDELFAPSAVTRAALARNWHEFSARLWPEFPDAIPVTQVRPPDLR